MNKMSMKMKMLKNEKINTYNELKTNKYYNKINNNLNINTLLVWV